MSVRAPKVVVHDMLMRLRRHAPGSAREPRQHGCHHVAREHEELVEAEAVDQVPLAPHGGHEA